MTGVRAALLPIVAVLSSAVTACDSGLPPDRGYLRNIPQIERAIELTLYARVHARGTAYCPDEVPALEGEVFSCLVSVGRERPVLFEVTEVNASGYVTYAEIR